MKISLNWLQQSSSAKIIPKDVSVLTQKIGAQLGAIEEVIELGSRYDGIVVAKVVSCKKHANADKLHVCLIDDGAITKGAKRNKDGLVQVVCGAPNVREGLLVAWLPPGITVPSSVDKDPFVLEAREIRGEVSNGMLASLSELAISEDHSGILEIDEKAKPGQALAEVYALNDTVIDIENKMFTHRPDCFGVLGVARELAGIQGLSFTSPDWYMKAPKWPVVHDDALPLKVKNELPKLTPRFMAVTIQNVDVKPSPIWLQSYLSRVGVRPINNIVDITNYLMLLTAQPLHAYDYDKVIAHDPGAKHVTLKVRAPQKGESLTLLNGKTIEPNEQAVMIATDNVLIGVGGVMGGADTEVDENTKNIILECATFDMYSIRRTSMHLGLFSDAVTRFNKGQSPLQNDRVLAKAMEMLGEIAHGKVASKVIDDQHLEGRVHPSGKMINEPVKVEVDFINARLGLDLSAKEITMLLTNVEFKVDHELGRLVVSAPFWRTDIEIPEDVVEEVGRLYGYDHLPLDLPKRDLKAAKKDWLLQLKAFVRDTLADAGANEVLTYSFVHSNLLEKIGQDTTKAFELSNAISPELQYYRVSLTPSLLEKVHPNIKAGHDQFALFEIGKSHVKGENDPLEPKVPKELNGLALVFAAEDKTAKNIAGAPYYQARKYLMNVLASSGAQNAITLELLDGADLYHNPWAEQLVAPYEPKRSAILRDNKGLIWGVVGEFRTSVRKQLKLPNFSAGFEIDPLLLVQGNGSNYVALPRFPKVEQDICLRVAADMTYGQLFNFVWEQIQKLQPEGCFADLGPIDIYQKDTKYKQITLRLSIASYTRTMTDEEVNNLLDEVARAAKEKFAAVRV
jgi:phenylalanyl-tRNA synthetase beta chain